MNARVVDDLDELTYHASPALSASGAKRLIQTCPAVFKHERDNGRTEKRAFDFGHAAHGLILGVGQPVHVIEATGYTTKAARETRDAAYAAGEVPVLAAEWEQVQAMAEAVKLHPLAAALLADGTAEQSIFWTDDRYDVERRARFDWLTHIGTRPCVVDYKTTISADPRTIGRKVADFGYHQQHAWYTDAARAAGISDDPAFLFIFQEKHAPYLVSVVELDERAIARGAELNDRALEVFRDCTASGVWPSYVADANLARVSLPRWAYYDNDLEIA